MASAGEDIEQMQAQIDQWGNITQNGVEVNNISGTADDPDQTSGEASKTNGGFFGPDGVYDGTWEVGNWGDTLVFTIH
jgi:hypothetical protein